MQCHLCKLCDARRGGVLHNVANIWCDLKCDVQYMECGTYYEMGRSA